MRLKVHDSVITFRINILDTFPELDITEYRVGEH